MKFHLKKSIKIYNNSKPKTMKTITINGMILTLLFLSFSTQAQTYVYNETTSSGIFFESGNGEEIANPLSDDVNSSATVAFSGTDNPFPWLEIQFFPNPGFTPSSDDKLYFSVYNPDSAPGAQIQFNNGELFGGNVTYDASSQTGWVEYSVDLGDLEGNELNQIILFPVEGTSIGVYVDNIYFNNESVITPPSTGTTFVYNEDVSSGIFFESGNGAEQTNPVSDAVNSSANCAFSGTDNPFPWLEIQFFPSPAFTASTGDKLFFSVYNPDAAPGAQIQFNSGAFFGGNVTYDATNTTGWVEYSIDLDDEVGNEITQVILYPVEGTSIGVFVDNIYFANSSVLSIDNSEFVEELIFINQQGQVIFENAQSNAELHVFDLNGRLIFKENVEGRISENTLNTKGVYIIKAVNGRSVNTRKLIFN